MEGTRNSALRLYQPFLRPQAPADTGGGVMRQPFTLQMLWDWHQQDWNVWSRGTDGYNLVRYVGCKLTFYPHPDYDYIVHWSTDFWKSDNYSWPFFHPSKMINMKFHKIIWSKRNNPNRGTTKIKIKPPALKDNGWYFMGDQANRPLFLLQATLIDMANPFMDPDEVTGPFKLTWSQDAPANPNQYYWWIWDKGKNNAVYVGPNNPGNVWDLGFGKNVPFYISLWGFYNASASQNIWLWFPDTNFGTPNEGNRTWCKLSIVSVNNIIQRAPYAMKTAHSNFSITMKYQFKFQFGGPDVTDGYVAGTAPRDIPPGYGASEEQPGIQNRSPAEAELGVLNNWEIRRGIATPRGYARLTEGLPISLAAPLFGEPRETEPWPSEEEESSSEEEAPQKKRKLHRKRHSY